VGHIRQLESLGYFVEGSPREPGKETIPKPADDEDAATSGPNQNLG
jgi:hypothetical protein